MKLDFFKKKAEDKGEEKQKSVAREWADAILFASANGLRDCSRKY